MRKLGKRLFGAILATVLLLTMGFSTFAAKSPTGGTIVDIIDAKDKNGNSVEIKVIPVQSEHKDIAEAIKDKNNLKDVLGNKYVDGMEVLDVCDLIVIGDASLVEFPVTVKFKVPGVKEGTKVEVLCYVNGAWKILPCVVGNGTVTVTFNSLEELSTVAFVVDKNTMAPSSPETGENTMLAVAGLAVVLAAAGAVVLRKKEFAR